ncbi:nucleotidyltransferase domain-containing protein [Acidobacteria bacterium AH-259-D05]|nr:nucleotidyltransferase domain-containing protein [Acidobacteria bacterium AH-259-D05]
MPVRSLNSLVLKWPDAQTVAQAVRRWSIKALSLHHDVIRIGYFGSYARSDWGVGSDLDLIIVVESSHQPFERRASKWDVTELPVPADVLVYTNKEWQSLDQEGRFYRTLMKEAVWVYIRGDANSA